MIVSRAALWEDACSSAIPRAGARLREPHDTRSDGYTLLELIVVVILVALMTAGVTPMFRDSLFGVRADRIGRDLVATLRHAGELAIIQETEVRVYFDTEAGAYWLASPGRDEDGKRAFQALEGKDGLPQYLPESMEFDRVTARRGDKSSQYYVRFFPGGATDVARVALKGRDADRLEIEVKGSAGRIGVKAK